MELYKLSESGDRGWYVGNFPKAIIPSTDVEVCYRVEPVGSNIAHYHRVCTETLLIANGRAIINGIECSDGDIVVLRPGEINSTTYLVPTVIVTVKTPAGGDDKVDVI